MKRWMKRVLSYVLTAVLLLGALPLTAFPVQAAGDALTNVSATITLPVAGQRPVRTGTVNNTAAVTVSNVTYYTKYSSGSGAYKSDDETFSEGENLTIYVSFAPAEKVDSETNVTVNGYSTYYGTDNYAFDYTVPMLPCTVSFDTDGGTLIADQIIDKNTCATRPADPTKEGYTFAGWYSSPDLDQEWDFSWEIDEDTTIYAKWLKKQYVTISFDPGEGSGSMTEVSELRGAQYTLPDSTFTAPGGMEFDYWIAEDYGAKNAGETITLPTDKDSITWTARWKNLPTAQITITQQPQSKTVTEGVITGSVSVAATVDPAQAIRYSWRMVTPHVGETIIGEDAPSVEIPKDLSASVGTYEIYCVLFAGGTSATSERATITVQNPTITITQQPQNKTVTVGAISGSVSVAATVDSAHELHYSWRLDSPVMGEVIIGEDAASVEIPTDLAASVGTYEIYCVLTAGGSMVTSDRAVITVEYPTITITGQPQSKTVTEGAISGTLTVAAEVNSSYELQYSWRMITPHLGETIIGGNYPAVGIPTDLLASVGTYEIYCVISAGGASLNSDKAILTVVDPSIQITGQPGDITMTQGEVGRTFSVTASADSSLPLHYSWRVVDPQLGESVFGSDAPTAEVPGAWKAKTYEVYCIVSCGQASVQSARATLTILPPVITVTEQPADAIVTEGEITGSLSVAATVNTADALQYTWILVDPDFGEEIIGENATTVDIPTHLYPKTYGIFCRITAGEVSVDSDTASITVLPKETVPAEGLFLEFLDGEYDETDKVYTYIYTGAKIIPSVNVYFNGSVLKAGTDYTLSYSNNTNASTDKKSAAVTVTGKGNLAGKKTFPFRILPKSIADGPEKGIQAGVIHIAKGQKATAPVITYGSYVLQGKDYTIADPKKIYTETGEMTVTGKGNFTGTRKVPVVVEEDKADVKKLTVLTDTSTPVTFMPYDSADASDAATKEAMVRAALSAQIKVYASTDKAKATPLTENVDYTLSFPGQVNAAGSKKVVVKGIGSFTGSVTKTLSVKPRVAAPSEVVITNEGEIATGLFEYDPKGVLVDPILENEGYILRRGIDYTVTYSGNKAVSTPEKKAKYNIAFIGNYKGTAALKNREFSIVPKALSVDETDHTPVDGVQITIAPVVYKGKPDVYKPKVYLTVDGTLLPASKYLVDCYTDEARGPQDLVSSKNKVTLPDGASETTVYVRITPKDKNYKGAIDTAYTVVRTGAVASGTTFDLSKARVTIYDSTYDPLAKKNKKLAGVEYNGKPRQLDDADIQAKLLVEYKLDGKTYTALQEGVDYTIRYVNNLNKGTATIVVEGTQTEHDGMAFAGSKTATFRITTRSVLKWLELLGL